MMRMRRQPFHPLTQVVPLEQTIKSCLQLPLFTGSRGLKPEQFGRVGPPQRSARERTSRRAGVKREFFIGPPIFTECCRGSSPTP